MMKICIFCGNEADTKEHIVPRWLQKYFDLKDQRLGLWNNTSIQYCQTVIPACQKCNSETFSRLEAKIRENNATEQDYYLWALKIRFCLSLKDTTLPLDQSNPNKGPLLNEEIATISHEFVKHSFTHLEKKKFFFRPYPFGSVFIFKNPVKDNKFGLVDASHPYWALTIALPNNILLSVLFTDRGLVKKEIEKQYKSLGGLKHFARTVGEQSTAHFTQFLTFKLLLWQYKISNIPYDVKLKKDGVYSKKLPNKIKYRDKLKLSILQDIANICGLPNDYGKEIYNSLPHHYRG